MEEMESDSSVPPLEHFMAVDIPPACALARISSEAPIRAIDEMEKVSKTKEEKLKKREETEAISSHLEGQDFNETQMSSFQWESYFFGGIETEHANNYLHSPYLDSEVGHKNKRRRMSSVSDKEDCYSLAPLQLDDEKSNENLEPDLLNIRGSDRRNDVFGGFSHEERGGRRKE
ncbi:hypothetical protein RFI_39705 [Reticulomyxa filosa]|uniref:Uncharacterized protein n=1 Tax=Reticulomyxa filosa TaxID=46433 RepID=X6L9L2_RETFI|nr:hypothetical protein RFI_39705 [Reticulomyxa filosa]|eukprot:ETN97821.1 hypothetical protein RFI_39705 [Reticulomyxa filosa]